MAQSNLGCTVMVCAEQRVLAQTRICRDECDIWLIHAAREM